MKDYSKLISSIKRKSINDEEVSYSKKKKGFLSKKTFDVLVLSFLALGIISISTYLCSSLVGTSNDKVIDSETSSDVLINNDNVIYILSLLTFLFGGSVAAGFIDVKSIKLYLTGYLLSDMSDNELQNAIFRFNDKSYLDYKELAKDLINSKNEVDINIILYSVFYNLINLPAVTPLSKEFNNQYEFAVESMNMIFIEMQKLIKGHANEYSIDIVQNCNFSSFKDYLYFKKFNSIDDYEHYMNDVFLKRNVNMGRILLKDLNNQELDYKYFGDCLLSYEGFENNDMIISNLFLKVFTYFSYTNSKINPYALKKDENDADCKEFNNRSALEFMNSVFNYMYEKIRGNEIKYSEKTLISCN
ncbi:MAG: hypothetical protein RSF02_01940, partial [Bacilli bacterium]